MKGYTVLMCTALALAGCSQQGQKTPAEEHAVKMACQSINENIDKHIKEYAINDWDGQLNDKSAIQQNARISQGIAHLSIINSALMQLQNLGCPARLSSVDPSGYGASARECYSHMLQQRLDSLSDEGASPKGEKVDPCDFSKWKSK